MPGLWMEWSPWSECSENCGACGKRTRGRLCTRGVCYGSAFEAEICNRGACRPGTTIDGGVSSRASYQSSTRLPNWCCSGFNLRNGNFCIPTQNG
ncbi:hypothetical protein KIN20_007168 [Parelaphostrongylus tenuis]|uniref:Uncharacterized protein n=1 Tax=Parelaphostrongylus tenuis TaxID=148309 RepID=A0AAD5M7F0_PARTN|nr:hypothetical protein KIN20_007168 [Parelaphostrongylus tenuis]